MDDNRIFIGKIPQSVTEPEIRTHFGKFGEIEHVQCPTSNKAFKIAFVTYTDATGRDQALAFTEHSLQNSPLNVVKASPKPQRAPDGPGGPLFGQQQEARVFVGHIPEEVSEEMLQTYFSTFGTLLKCFKPNSGSRSTNPPGYAFVTFSSHKEKHLCLAQEAHVVGGHALRVMEAKPKPQTGGFGGPGAYGGAPPTGFGGGFGGASYNPYGLPGGASGFGAPQRQDETNPKRVFISHMQPSIQDAELRTHFSQFGIITDVFIPQPQPTDSTPEDPKGFAYVTFEDSQSVYRALAVKEHVIHGTRLDVQEARPKSSRQQPRPPRQGHEARVFIGKIPKHITDDVISAHFSQFGEVKEFYRPRDQNARDGFAFGFLTYTSINELARCLAVLEHVLSDGTVLSVTRARPRPAPGGGTAGAGPSGSDMGFTGGQQMQVPQMFGQQAYATPQAYNPYGQQPFAPAQQYAAAGQQQFSASVQPQQFAPLSTQQQFAAQGQVGQVGQFGATNPQFAINQSYGGQMQQASLTQGYGATQQPRTNQRYNPY